MSRPSFWQDNITGRALAPQSIADAGAANGDEVANAHKLGRQLSFVLCAGAMASVTVFTCKLQYKDSSGTWNDYLGQDGTVIKFDAADTVAASGGLKGGSLIGTIDLTRGKGYSYRLVVATNTGAASLVSAIYIISDLYDRPSGKKDHFIWKQLPYTEAAPADTTN